MTPSNNRYSVQNIAANPLSWLLGSVLALFLGWMVYSYTLGENAGYFKTADSSAASVPAPVTNP